MTGKLRIEMLGVCKAFGATVALDRMDLRAAPDRMGLRIGKNGAGKNPL